MRIAGLILLFAVCGPIHIVTKTFLGRSGWPKSFLAAAAWIAGARVTVRGDPAKPHSLLLANHITWLDILILGGWVGSAFVSKDNLGHGLIHWLADQNGTIYVKREHRRGAAEQARTITEALGRQQPLTIFPEGTIGPGDNLLPFRSALLAAAAPPPDGVEVRPVAIDYGSAVTEVSWYGRSGRDNILDVLGRKGSLSVTVQLLPPLERTADRKQLANKARDAIAAALGLQVATDLPYRPGG